MSAAFAFAAAYVLGSLPGAQVFVKWVSRRDLSTSGSGNLGALNAMRVTRSPALGVAVMAFDATKGAAAVLVARALGAHDGFGIVGAVAGHNYNLWLALPRRRVVGGKGFAAAAGGLLCTMPWLVAVWLAVGVLAWVLIRVGSGIVDEAPASAVATLATVPAGWLLHGAPGAAVTGALCVLILPKLAREVLGLVRDARRKPA